MVSMYFRMYCNYDSPVHVLIADHTMKRKQHFLFSEHFHFLMFYKMSKPFNQNFVILWLFTLTLSLIQASIFEGRKRRQATISLPILTISQKVACPSQPPF